MTICYFGLYVNGHRGKTKKAGLAPLVLWIVEEEEKRIPSRRRAKMIRKVYELGPLVSPQCGDQMKVIAFITDFCVVDRIINHLWCPVS